MFLNPPLPSSAPSQLRWGQLHGAATALAIAETAQRSNCPLLVIAAGAREAERLQGEIAVFAPRDLPVQLFPDWETLPYDLFAPHPDIVSQRLATLHGLPQLARGVVLVSLATLLQRLPPRQWIDGHVLDLATGDRLDLASFRDRLIAAGYAHVAQVTSHGEFAVRGSLLDIYPMGSDRPVRIDLFDDRIDSIRIFDPETQRSTGQYERLRLLPAREYPLDAQGVRDFRGRYRVRFEGDPNRSAVYRQVSDGIAPAGIEYYLPLFYDQLESLFDYLPSGTVLIDTADMGARAGLLWNEIIERYEQRRHDVERAMTAHGAARP